MTVLGAMWRRVVLAVAVNLLIGVSGQALAAGQQDYDDCSQMGDVIRGMVACTRIIENQSESAADRAGAYVQRGSDYVASGKLVEAIADYGEAIKLDPRNVTAYAARAVAYWRKGERDHAVIDYAIANALDPKSVAGITAENPEIATIGVIAFPPAAPDSVVQAPPTNGAFCPTADTARNGFVLVKGSVRINVMPSTGEIVTKNYVFDDKPGQTETYYRGRFILSRVT